MAARILIAVLIAASAHADETLGDRWDKAKRESFEMKGAWPEHVVEEIRKRYDVPFGLQGIDLKRADFVAQDVTFFEALDRFAAVHGLHVAGVPGQDRRVPWETDLKLVRVEPEVPPTPVAYVGPTRISVEGVARVTLQRCGPALEVPEEFLGFRQEEEEMPRLRVRLRWLVEPGFEDAELAGWTCDQAVDDLAGRCAPFERRYGQRRVQANRRFVLELRPPREGAKKLARLELRTRIALPVAREEITFDAGEVGATKTLGGARITFAALEGTKVRFKVDGSLTPEFDTPSIVLPSWPGDMEDVVVRAYSESGAQIEGDLELVFRRSGVQLASAPKRLVLSGVTKVAIRQATAVFTDVPLPQ